MPKFSRRSRERLSTCDQRLYDLFDDVVRRYDCAVLVGHRTEPEQEEAFRNGRSKLRWPESKHNHTPSLATDVAPYLADRGVPWPKTPRFLARLTPAERAELGAYLKDTAQFYHFAGYVEATADAMNVRLRWGGDWDRDRDLSDQSFDDLVHFEIVT